MLFNDAHSVIVLYKHRYYTSNLYFIYCVYFYFQNDRNVEFWFLNVKLISQTNSEAKEILESAKQIWKDKNAV